MNRKRKGNLKEKEAMEILESKGYQCERVRNVPFHHGDLWGCADVVALNSRHIKFIAVTSKPNKSRALKAFQKLRYKPKFLIREVWLYGKGSDWEVIEA